MRDDGADGPSAAALVTAGLVVGAVEVVIALSFAALVFTNTLPERVAAGTGLVLAGGVVMLVIIGLGATRPGSAGSVQDIPAVLVASAATAIVARVSAPEAAFATIVALMAVSAVACGLAFVAAGWLRLGRLIRFLPYSVVGGFLAGTGVVLLRGGLDVAASSAPGWLFGLTVGSTATSWALTMAVGVSILALLHRTSSVWILPGVVGLATVAFHAVRLAGGHDLASIAADGWVLDVALSGPLWAPFGGADLGAIDGGALLAQAPLVLTLVALSSIALLLQVSGIEVSVGEDLDLDRELRVAGVANLGVAAGGGIPGFHALAFTALNERTGVRSRWSPLVAAGFCLVVMAGGGAVVGLVPRFVLGGVLVLIGLDFLMDWVIEVRHRVTRPEYVSILAIATVVAFWGFLPAVIAGLAAAVILFALTYSRIEAVHSQATLAEVHSTVDRPEADHVIRRAAGRAVPVVELQGYLFFGTASRVVERIHEAAADVPLEAVVLDLSRVTGTDSSAMQSFVRLRQFVVGQGATLLVSGWDAAHLAAIVDPTLAPEDGGVLAFDELDRALEHAEEVLLSASSQAPRVPLTAEAALRAVFSDGPLAARLDELAERRTLQAGEVLMERGGPPSQTFDVVISGLLDVENEGRRLRRLGPASLLGEVAYLTGGSPSATVVAVTDVELRRIGEDVVAHLEAHDPACARELARVLGRIAAERLTDVLETLSAVRR